VLLSSQDGSHVLSKHIWRTKPNPQPVFASHFYSIVCLAQTPQGASLPSITAEHGGRKVDNFAVVVKLLQKENLYVCFKI
jgi:hypothetical protein